jgi:protease IV
MSNWDQEHQERGFFSRFFSRLFRWARNFFALIGLAYTLVPILIIWFIIHASNHNKPAPQSTSTKGKHPIETHLWLHLDRPLLANEPRSSRQMIMSLLGGRDGIYLPQIRSALRSAAEDKNVVDLNIVFDGLHGSTADLEELTVILKDFRDSSKKPTVAYVHHMDNAALMVSAQCDKVILAPVAEVMVPGPVFGQVYFGEALKKLGIEMQVVRAGKYKSAFEAFIANEPSPESKEMMSSLESSIRNHMVKLIADGRKKQVSEANLWLKESIFTAAKAKELGMVDELDYQPVLDPEDESQVDVEEYALDHAPQKTKGYSLKAEKGIALIEASGEIVGSADDGEFITPDAMRAELEWARQNDDVAAVVLRVASPGGSAAASDEIWEFVRRLNETKPVIASFGSVAASGGYYISAAARKIVANPTTVTGSIGVIGMIPNLEGFKDKYGITFPTTTQSNRGAMLSGGKKMTPEDHHYIGSSIDETYRTFKSRVSEGRKLSMDQVEALAQGRVYSGLQAKQLGLVDELGGLKDAMQIAKKEGGLDPNKLYQVYRYEPEQVSLSECLSSVSKMKRCLKRAGVHAAVQDTLYQNETAQALREAARLKSTLTQSVIQTRFFGPIGEF